MHEPSPRLRLPTGGSIIGKGGTYLLLPLFQISTQEPPDKGKEKVRNNGTEELAAKLRESWKQQLQQAWEEELEMEIANTISASESSSAPVKR